MTTFFVILGIIAVIVFIANGSKKTGSSPTNNVHDKRTNNYSYDKKQTRTQVNSSESLPTVAELVNSVKNLDDLRKFEKKEKEIETKYGEDLENKHYGKLYQRYSDAFSKLCDKVLFYQYFPVIDIDTPHAILLEAYKYYTVEDYKQRKKGTKPDHWLEISAGQIMGQTIESPLEPKPQYLDTLIKFRETVEGTLTPDEKSNTIRDLVAKDFEFKKTFFLEDNESEKLIQRYSKTKKMIAKSKKINLCKSDRC